MGILSLLFNTLKKWGRWFIHKFRQLRDYIYNILWTILQNRTRELTRRRDARRGEDGLSGAREAVAGFSPGRITSLTLMATPGAVSTFSAKTEAEVAAGEEKGFPIWIPIASMKNREITTGGL